MLLESDDANAHERGPEHDWRESYYCNFCDPHSDLCGVAWQGARPNAGHGEAVFVLCDGASNLIRSVDPHVPIAPSADPARKIGSQEFVCVESWRRWDVRFEQPEAKIEVNWTQMSDVCDWDWEDLTNSKHFQAAGTVKVSGHVAGRRIAFNGYGERDRAWGARNYGPLKYSVFMTAQFPDDVAVHAFVLRDAEGVFRLFGYIHREGTTRGLARCEVTVKYAGERGPPSSGSYLLIDDIGRRVEIENFALLNHVGFGAADSDGSQLSSDLSGTRSLMFLTFQRFTRRDGVQGRGMIDLNCWVGQQEAHFVSAAPPIYSTLYPFGRRR
ncbi:MAG TPA: hypothetical protein VHB68_17330 [Steroidobacteraceae bacterium]|nr:hypothetical protein [Steroidobacteraceae bacterium]